MDRDEAKRLASSLPTRRWGASGGTADHGFRRASSAEYGGKVTLEQALGADVEEVPVAELRACQGSVSRKGVVRYLLLGGRAEAGRTDAGSAYPRDLPIVVLERGRYFLHDGHHRATAQKLLGAKAVEARVVRVERCPLKAWAHGPAGSTLRRPPT